MCKALFQLPGYQCGLPKNEKMAGHKGRVEREGLIVFQTFSIYNASVLMIVAVMRMVMATVAFVHHIIHLTYRAFACLVAAAAFAVHGADVGGGVFRAVFIDGFFGRRIFVLGRAATAAGGQRKERCAQAQHL